MTEHKWVRAEFRLWYHARMLRALSLATLVLALAAPSVAADPIAEARRLYNRGDYEAAERSAREALAVPGRADAARVVLGRIQLERFRQTASRADLDAARNTLKAIDPSALDGREQIELVVGLAEALFLEDRFGAAAVLFESALDNSALLGPSARERVLDWWATALDRQAQLLPSADRAPLYARLTDRMREELSLVPASTTAGYWLAASARAAGNPDAAWSYAIAAWVRAGLAEDRGAALRADLNRLVVQAIIPERAAKLAGKGDPKLAQTSLLSEWEAFQNAWSR